MLTTVGIVLVGVLLIVVSYRENQDAAAIGPSLGDHWHSYLGVNICGTWQPPVNEFHGRDGTMAQTPAAGIHAHGDFLIHEHPGSSDETGKNADLGLYLEYAQTELSATAITLSETWAPGVLKKNGDTCSEGGKPGVLQWKVGRYQEAWPTKARAGNPADYHLENGDIIAIYFLPKGEALEEPPGSQAALSNISDLGDRSQLPTTSSTAPTPDTTPASTPSSSSPAGGASTNEP